MMDHLLIFTAGAIAMGFFTAALFFLRFWRRTGDGLFIAFSLAFFLLGLGQGMLTFLGVTFEEQSWLYLVRLAAFLCIIIAIVRKNRSASF